MGLLESGEYDADHLIFFFGDSSVAGPFLTQRDPNYLNTPKFLESELQLLIHPHRSVRVVDWSFAAASMFEYYCLLCRAEKYAPSLIIVPINWRFFTPLVYDDPQWDFSELSALAPLLESFGPGVESPMDIERISLTDRFNLSCRYWGLYATGVKRWLKSTFKDSEAEQDVIAARRTVAWNERRLFEKLSKEKLDYDWAAQNYPMRIDEDNKMLRLLRAFSHAAERRNIQVIFYVTPINIEQIKAVGAFEADLFQESLERMVDTAASRGAVCLDLSGLLGSEFFLDPFEHYAEEGHRRIASLLLPEILEKLKFLSGKNEVVRGSLVFPEPLRINGRTGAVPMKRHVAKSKGGPLRPEPFMKTFTAD